MTTTVDKKQVKRVPKLRFKGHDEVWFKRKINELLKIGSGRDYKHLKSGDIPVFGTGGLMTKVNEALYEGETVFIGRKGSIDKPFYFNGKFWTVDTLFYTHSFKECEPYFIYNIFQKVNWYKHNEASGVPSLSKKTIESIVTFVPSLPEQKKIADFLSAVDTKIQQLTRKKELLEQYKKGVMQKLFSQEIRFKDENGNDFPEWEEKRLGNISIIEGGGTPETNINEYWNGDINWFTPTEIRQRTVKDSERKITNLGLLKSSAKLLPIGTILFTSRATIAEVSFALKESTTNQGFQSIIVSDKNDSNFVYYLIKNNKKVFIRKSQGSTFLEISKKEMSKIRFNIPSKEEQVKIGNYLSSIDDKIEKVNQQITQTQTFKKGLLQQMFV
ncbi:MAG: restriction endonuclease subunit S [Fulvivirga sp.]|uniref:restriction endonuclease subunit S n=1 Tax=Fulvivirga sp. TaxID=1931237 RepID=UPI0032EDA977